MTGAERPRPGPGLLRAQGVGREPGLYFMGLEFQYSVSSDVITGVGRDAEYVVKHIAARRTDREPAMAGAMA